jgi:hypothetical protein
MMLCLFVSRRMQPQLLESAQPQHWETYFCFVKIQSRYTGTETTLIRRFLLKILTGKDAALTGGGMAVPTNVPQPEQRRDAESFRFLQFI